MNSGKHVKGIFFIGFFYLILFSICSLGESTKSVSIRFPAMGTEFVFIIYPPTEDMLEEDVRNLCSPALEAVHQLEKHISHYRENNELARLNQSAGTGFVSVNRDLLEVLAMSQFYWERTRGAFDPTVGPLLELWGFHRKNRETIPTMAEIRSILTRVGMDKVRINVSESKVELTVPGMKLDFGGIGKGLALDRAGRILREQGIRRGVLHSGTSTVLALDSPPGEKGWKIGIRSPYNKDEVIEQFMICNESLSTSSISEQYLQRNGRKYGHIFDPRTGMPVETCVLSTTVIAKSASETDALSTAFFVMGPDKTIEYCNNFPDVKAFMIEEKNNELKKLYININKKE